MWSFDKRSSSGLYYVEAIFDIQDQLKTNQAKVESMGTARDGRALLAGLLICGICNRRMSVSYDQKGKSYRYACTRNYIDYGQPNCQSLQGENLDELVENQVLKALEPASIELSIAAINNSWISGMIIALM